MSLGPVPCLFFEIISCLLLSVLHPKPHLQIATSCHTSLSLVQLCIYISHLFIQPGMQLSDALLLPWSQLSIALLDSDPILSQIFSNQDSLRPSRMRVYFMSSNTCYQNKAGCGRVSSITFCFLWCHNFQYPDLSSQS